VNGTVTILLEMLGIYVEIVVPLVDVGVRRKNVEKFVFWIVSRRIYYNFLGEFNWKLV